MSRKSDGTAFEDAIRVLNSPEDIHYQVYVSGVRAVGHMKCGPPPWDRDGIYRLALASNRLVIQHLQGGDWVDASTTRPTGAEVAARQPLPTTVNNFHGPIGAVAAASGATAHGTAVVHQIDDAMRRVIERQDELAELADALLPLLRKARRLENAGVTESALVAAVAEAEEFNAFAEAVKPGLSRAAASAAAGVLELVPTLKAALALLGGG